MLNFSNDIAYGTISSDVTRLQQYLIDNHYADFTQTSGYFGDKTKLAVAKFQSLHGIVPTSGVFGPKTRAMIDAVIPSNQTKLLATVLSMLGKDATPLDAVSDEVACAETVNAVFTRAFGVPIGGRASTALMRQVLVTDSRFKKLDAFEPGCIIISATGLGNNPAMPHGHAGIVIDANRVASNNSLNGILDIHYTVPSWIARYQIQGGFLVEFFKVK